MKINKIMMSLKNLKVKNSINKENQNFTDGENIFMILKFKYIFYYVDVDKYSSGTLYTAFGIKPKGKMSVHNAMWDSISLFLSLRYKLEKNQKIKNIS